MIQENPHLRTLIDTAEAEHHHREPLNEVLSYRSLGRVESVVELKELVAFLTDLDENDLHKGLDRRQQRILDTWIANGIRFDTAHWMRSLAVHFHEKSLLTPEAIITALFVDTYNRADDILDSYRDHFLSNSGGVTTEKLRRVPILALPDNTFATVGEFMDILQRLIKLSGVFSSFQIAQLNKGIRQFLEQSRQTIEQLEITPTSSVISYSKQNAVMLREKTLYPLVTLACQMFASIKYQHTEFEPIAAQVEQEMRSLAMAAQVLDDRNDFKEDFRAKNTNIVLGILNDICRRRGLIVDQILMDNIENAFNYQTYEYNPDLVEIFDMLNYQLGELYEKYYRRLHHRVRQIMPTKHDIGILL